MKKEMMNHLISAWSAAQAQTADLPCPCCGAPMRQNNSHAQSRRATIQICQDCGIKEAMEDYSASQSGVDTRTENYTYEKMTRWYLFCGMVPPYIPVENRDDCAISKVANILVLREENMLEAMQQAIESEMDISISRLLRDYVTGNVEDMIVALTGWDMRTLLMKAEMYNKEEK